MPRQRTVIDIETRSEVDLSEVGAYRYAMHPSTDVLVAQMWTSRESTPTESMWFPGRTWNGICEAFPYGTIIQAYNDTFDYLIWKHILTPRYGWRDPDDWQWEDLMARAAYANLPAKLDDLAPVLGTPEKDAEGHRLMMRLAQPARPTRSDPNPWRLHTTENLCRLAEYCRQDVVAEVALDDKLPLLPEFEKKVQRADRAMNSRGIRVDADRVIQMRALVGQYMERLREDLRSITRGRVERETQLPALRAFCNDNGLIIRDGPGALDRYAIDGFLNDEYYGEPMIPLAEDSPVRLALVIRRLLGKSSLAKLDALQRATCDDSRVRGMFQYLGAKMTKRWAGRIIQPQNLPKGVLKGSMYDTALAAIDTGDVELLDLLYGGDGTRANPNQVMDVLSSCLRCCLIATPGNQLTVVDYNAIEARVAAWFANEPWLLDCFATGRDPYKQMASWITGKSPEEIDKAERDDGKLAELSCQYGLGGRGLQKQAKQRGRVAPLEFWQHVVSTYREKHPNIKRRWSELEEAAHAALRHPGTVYEVGCIRFKFSGDVLKMRLPDGNCTWFNRASIIMAPVPWDEDELRPKVQYWGEDSQTGQFVRQTAWGGDFMALACQGMARSLLAHALVTCEENRTCPVLTVHDELGHDQYEYPAPVITEMMCSLPEWARGLPIRAESFDTLYYHK